MARGWQGVRKYIARGSQVYGKSKCLLRLAKHLPYTCLTLANPLVTPCQTLAKPLPEIIHYQPDSSIRLEVRMEGETVWLTKAQMAMLFGCSIDNISFAAHLFPLSHSVARTIPQANAVSGRNLPLAKAVSEQRNHHR